MNKKGESTNLTKVEHPVKFELATFRSWWKFLNTLSQFPHTWQVQKSRSIADIFSADIKPN